MNTTRALAREETAVRGGGDILTGQNALSRTETDGTRRPHGALAPEQDRNVDDADDFLAYPDALSRTEADSARQQIGSLPPDQRQGVLDVLAAMIGAGEIRKSPLAALGGLIRRCRSGAFDPAPGLHLAEQRERRAVREASRQRREAEATGPPPSAGEISDARSRLRLFVNPRRTHG